MLKMPQIQHENILKRPIPVKYILPTPMLNLLLTCNASILHIVAFTMGAVFSEHNIIKLRDGCCKSFTIAILVELYMICSVTL